MQAVGDDPRRPSLPTGISPYARRGYHQQLSELLGAEDPKELLGLLLRCPALPQRLEESMELPGELRLVADRLVQPPTDAVDVDRNDLACIDGSEHAIKASPEVNVRARSKPQRFGPADKEHRARYQLGRQPYL